MDARFVGLAFVVAGVIGFALIVAPALVEIGWFRARILLRRWRNARQAHALSASRDGQGVQRRARIVAMSFVPARQSRLEDHDDAA
jgi:hypothetical protein